MRLVLRARAARGIAAQRHDVADAVVPIVARNRVDLLLRRGDAGEMRGGLQVGLAHDAGDGGVRALARRAAGAVGDGDELRAQRRQPLDRRPQRRLHLLRLGREELEGDVDLAGAEQPALALRTVIAITEPPAVRGCALAFSCAAGAAGRSRATARR